MRQFGSLIENYSSINKKDNDSEEKDDLFLNLEVIANDSTTPTTPWRCHSIRKTFETARNILFYRIISEDEALSNNHNNISSNNNLVDTDDEDDVSDRLPHDENNFYRDISLKFRTNSRSHLFASDQDQSREVNLTCFIIAYKFHLNLIDLMGRVRSEKCLPLLNESYLASIQLDTFLSFKILLSKIFYSNQESNRLASFVYLTKTAYASISPLIQLSQSAKEVTSEIIEMDDNHDLETKLKESTNQIDIYFDYFIRHLAYSYYNLNEKSHSFKVEKSYLKNLTSNSNSDVSAEQKVTKLFKMHQEHNKAVMLSLTNTNLNKERDEVKWSESQVEAWLTEKNINQLILVSVRN